jgi:hypothetical protein
MEVIEAESQAVLFRCKKNDNLSGRALQGTKCLHSLEDWDRGFETNSKNGSLCFAYFVLSCVGDLPFDWLSSPKEYYQLLIDDLFLIFPSSAIVKKWTFREVYLFRSCPKLKKTHYLYNSVGRVKYLPFQT